MLILLDECVPRPFGKALAGCTVRTTPELGWAGKKNGDLLSLMMSAGHEILITVDQNLRFQQNLEKYGVAVIVMVAASNRLADLLPLAGDVQKALAVINAGDVVEIFGASLGE